MPTAREQLQADLAAVFADPNGPTVDVERTGFDRVRGIFAEESQRIDDNGLEVWSDSPQVELLAEDASDVALNDTVLTIEGIDYQAYNKTRPVNGMVTLFLTRDF